MDQTESMRLGSDQNDLLKEILRMKEVFREIYIHPERCTRLALEELQRDNRKEGEGEGGKTREPQEDSKG